MSSSRSVRNRSDQCLAWPLRSIAGAALLFLVAAVAGCPPDACPGCPEVASVEIVPNEVHAASGAKFRLTAIARDAAGNVIEPSPSATWEGDAVFEELGNVATVSVTGPGEIHIKAKVGSTWSSNAKMIVQASTAGPAPDMLDVDHQSGAPPSYVLLDGKGSADANCVAGNDRKLAVAGVTALPVNLVPACDNEIAVFGHERAPLIETLPAGAWTDGGDDIARSPSLPLSMPVKVWYFVVVEEDLFGDEPGYTGGLEIKTTQAIFNANRVGIVAAPVQHLQMPEGRVYGGNAQCTSFVDLPGFMPDKASFHLVYVASINWLSDPWAWACPDDPARGDVVLISWGHWLPTIAAHEVVHRLGLTSPPFDWAGSGHVTGLADFDQSNVMWSPIDLSAYADRFYLSLGQVYRVHAAKESWLNRGGIRPTGLTTKACPGNMTTGICPKVSLGMGTP